MTWERLGLVFRPDPSLDWQRSHAANPVAHPLEDHRYRVFFASRDADDRSHVGWFDLDLANPSTPLARATEPALAPGPPGHFDDHGVYASSLVATDEGLRLYYTGWNPGRGPLYYTSVGVAVSEDWGRSFQRVRPDPIMARGEHDPWMVSQPMVRREKGRWRMWYISGLGWEGRGDGLVSRYHVKHAESDDGLDWRRDGTVALELRDDERNIARLCVLDWGGGYRCWFPHKGGDRGYRIGCAASPDGVDWTRLETGGLDVSEDGWEADAVTYPWVIREGADLYLLYNGNGFGRDGVGLARWPGGAREAAAEGEHW